MSIHFKKGDDQDDVQELSEDSEQELEKSEEQEKDQDEELAEKTYDSLSEYRNGIVSDDDRDEQDETGFDEHEKQVMPKKNQKKKGKHKFQMRNGNSSQKDKSRKGKEKYLRNNAICENPKPIYEFIKLFDDKSADFIPNDITVNGDGVFTNISRDDHRQIMYLFAFSQTPFIEDAERKNGKIIVSRTLTNIFSILKGKKFRRTGPIYVFALDYQKLIPYIKWKQIIITYRKKKVHVSQNEEEEESREEEEQEESGNEEVSGNEENFELKHGDMLIRGVPILDSDRIPPSSITECGMINIDQNIIIRKNSYTIVQNVFRKTLFL